MSTGRFAWHDLQTTDPAAARDFYSALLGWTYSPVPEAGDYQMINASGMPIGGIGSHEAPTPAVWLSYMTTDDIEATGNAVTAAGGSLDAGPYDMQGTGRMSYLRDPEGIAFALFQGTGQWSDHAMPFSGAPSGVPSWHELVSGDVEKACTWYGQIFGWGHTIWDMGGFQYHGLLIGEAPVAGAYQAEAGGTPKSWVIYFEAPGTIDEAIASVPDLGGQVVMGRSDVPGTGSFALFSDPTGALFGLLDSEAM
jgi:predicted enzyme related to lactoylglutathione lyase